MNITRWIVVLVTYSTYIFNWMPSAYLQPILLKVGPHYEHSVYVKLFFQGLVAEVVNIQNQIISIREVKCSYNENYSYACYI